MRTALLGIGLAALVAAPASANCIPAKLAGTFNEANYVYIDMGPGVTNQQVVGAFYDCGNPNANNGTYAASEWLFVDLNGKLSMQANLGDARVNGCPASKLVTRLQHAPASSSLPVRFLTMVATEGAAGTTSAFDYSYLRAPGSMLVAVPLPRPRVTSSGRIPGGGIVLNGVLDPVAAGNTSGEACGAITGYEVVKFVGTSDPGRDPAPWTVAQTVPSDGSGATFSVQSSCSNPGGDEFFATRLLFGDGQKSDLVSRSLRVNCNPALAEPEFRVVPKRPTGAKKAIP